MSPIIYFQFFFVFLPQTAELIRSNVGLSSLALSNYSGRLDERFLRRAFSKRTSAIIPRSFSFSPCNFRRLFPLSPVTRPFV